MSSLQESDYGDGRDYNHGSPHLVHASLRNRVDVDLRVLVSDLIARHGQCRVLEVGAGHGSFTAVLVDAGATVTVTEMSQPSANYLRDRFSGIPEVTVVHDPEADQGPAVVARGCELVLFISVLHHIPDYVGAVNALVDGLPEGAAFYCTQDPIWYSDRSKWSMRASTLSYMLWRLAQGDLKRGLQTRLRRLRGIHDESNPADMVEYHVVRDGVDQKALAAALEPRFTSVELRTFWSTQSRLLQRLGERAGLESTFAIRATGRDAATRADIDT